MNETSDIVASIDTHLRDCRAQITALEAARAALGGADKRASRRGPASVSPATAATATAASPPAAPAKPARRRRRSKPAAGAAVVPAGKLEALLTDSDGLTTAALAQQSGGERSQVLALLRELETAGRVRRTGERRATKWHAITDEDRIAQRALELEAARRSAA